MNSFDYDACADTMAISAICAFAAGAFVHWCAARYCVSRQDRGGSFINDYNENDIL